MAKKKRVYEDDDGRSIADMSGVERRSAFSFGIPGASADKKDAPENTKEKHEPILSKSERRWYILGALKSALLIGGAYILGLGLFIWLLCLLWK